MSKNLRFIFIVLLFLTFSLGNYCVKAQSNTDIVITEISYNPPESGSDSTEFIEIYNTGSGVIDLTGWQFTSGVVYTFPSMTINSGSYVVIGVDSIALKNVYNYSDAYQWTSGGLSNGGEPIALKDHTGQLIDSLRYDDNSPWPTDPDGAGPTLVLCDPSADNTNGANWSTSTTPTPANITINAKTVYGSPGAADDACSSCIPTSSTISPVACASYTSPSGNYTWTTTGSYMDTIPNAEGCDSVITVNLTINPSPVLSVMVDSNVSCNGYLDGGATASASGGTMPYTYLWSNSATTASITGIAAGTYTVTITDDNTCTSTSSVTITEPIALLAATVVDSNTSCNGYADGGASAAASGGTMPYTYLWSNAATTASITGIVAGTYTVTITDNNGCTSSSSVTVTEPAALVAATVVDSNVSCNGYADGGATASASGGTMPYNYLWSNSATAASITGIMAGTYTVTITDGNGCTSTSSTTITEPAAMLVSTVVDSNASCNGYADGGATANVSGGSMPYIYIWSNAATTASITGIMAGTYTVTITDDGGCTATASATITEPAAILASAVVDSNASCNGYADGGATASASGGSMPYTYLWSNAATTASITGVMAGTYTVTITDDGGCTATASATITEPNAIAASIVVDSNVSCNGYMDGGLSAVITQVDTIFNEGFEDYTGSTTLTATTASLSGLSGWSFETTSPGRLRLQAGSGFYHSGSFAATMDVNPSGSYLDNFLVKQVDMSSYIGSDITLSFWFSNHGDEPDPNDRVWVRGSDTDSWIEVYDWESNSPSNGQWYYAEINVDSALTANSQTASSTFEIRFGQHDNFPASSTTGSDGLTIDDIILTSNSSSTGSYTFLWSNSATTASISGIAAGTYTVTITESGGCTTTASANVTEPAALVAATVVDSNVSCNGYADGGATASASGGTSPYVYAWSNSATTASITGIVAGTYTVTITDDNSCTSTSSVTITEPAALMASAVVDSNVSCNGYADGGATASASGGTMPYNYLWSNSATTASITGIVAGTYTVTITDDNACTSTSSVTITEPAALMASTVVDSNASCNGYADGGATASVTGGTMPYTYLWSNAATTASITGVVAGTYTVTITDDNSCTSTSSVTITEPTALIAATVVDSNVSCNGYADGGATASASGGTMPYNYIWSNSATTASITGIVAGTYTVTITDDNSCTSTSSVTITEPAALLVSTVVDSNVSCNAYADGGATASTSGGTMPYNYIWSNGATTASITGIAAGTYTVTSTDANGCTTSNSVTITEPLVLSVSAIADSNVSCNGLADGGAMATVNGGTTPYNYVWSNGATAASITGIAAGTYTVTSTDANGCSASNSVTITEPAVLSVSAVVDSNASCNGYADGGGTATATGGTMPYNYLWSNGATTATITGVTAGTYTVSVTDDNGCTASNTISITEPSLLEVTTVADSNVTCNGFADGGATATASGGTGSHTYLWSNGATTASITGISGGTYTVTATDDNGCTAINTVTITEPAILSIDDVITNDIMGCYGEATGSIEIIASGGTPAYEYSIDNQVSWQSSNQFNNLPAGDYDIFVRDANDCLTPYGSTISILQPAQVLVWDVDIVHITGCYGDMTGEILIDASGGTGILSYSIDGGNTFFNNNGNFTDLPAGFYDIVIVDENNCDYVAQSPVVVTQPDQLIINDVEVTDITDCYGNNTGALNIAATGGTGSILYSIDGGNTFVDNGGLFENLNGGDYNIFITDDNGCTGEYGSNPVTITQPTQITMSVNSGDVSECAGNNDGFISINAAGGNGGYTYSIDGGASWSSSADFTGLFAGSYEVWTQDNLGCMQEYSGNPVIVSEPDAIMYNEVIVSNLDCYGAGNGEIFIDATGGTGSLMYSIDGGATYQSDGNFTDLPVGDYDLFIKDENDCEVAYMNNPVVITQPNEIIVSDVEVVNESCSGSLGSITITASGGAGNLMYSIDNGNSYQSGNFFGNVPADTYIVKVKDGEGCEQFYPENPVSVLDLNPSSIVINVSPPTGTICVNETVTLEAIANEAVSYFWEPTGSADQVIYVTSDSPGTIEYTVTVINEDNCESQESVEIYYDECIGIPEINTESMTINIYPNPNKGEFLLEVSGANQDVDIAILDLSGRLIKKDKISDPDSNKTTKQFKLSELENGTYFVRISSNGNVNYKKFVKQ